MAVSAKDRELVRKRAKMACEYCGVREADAGGQLTIDHFQPQTKGGTDKLDNLLYCCIRCNQYKGNYWPSKPKQLSLWNPRHESFSKHFLELHDGSLHPLTPTAVFTLQHLHLNRPALIAYRKNRHETSQQANLLASYQELVEVMTRLAIQQSDVIEEQKKILQEQQELLREVFGRDSKPDTPT